MVSDLTKQWFKRYLLLHFFGVVRSEELQRAMVKFQGFKQNVNTRRSIFTLQVISYFP